VCCLTGNIFHFRDESLDQSDKLTQPDVLAYQLVEDFEAALDEFREGEDS
jgi:hypothetical protein